MCHISVFGSKSATDPRYSMTLSTVTDRAVGWWQFKGKTVLLGNDDLDVFKGIELKLAAVDRLLEYHREWRGKLVLIQITNAAR